MKQISMISRRVISGLLALLLLSISISVTAFAATPSDARNSVVLVVASFTGVDSEGYEVQWQQAGSGFAIGEPGKAIQYMVTNHHVVSYNGVSPAEGLTVASCQVTVYFSAAANRFMTAQVYRDNATKDVAVLRLPEPTTERAALVLCPYQDINLDDDFAALGYPSYADTYNDYMKYDTQDIVITKGGIAKQTMVGGTDVYLLDLVISNGNSGGPLVNSKGQVVGINTFGISTDGIDEEAYYAVTINELMRMIDRNEIPYATSMDGLPFIWLIVIIGGSVILLGVIAILIVVLVNSGKKKAKAAPMAQPVAEVKSPAYIRGVNGRFAGKNFNLSNRLVIGRDSNQCVIAYPMDTPGISGVHCEVVFDGRAAYIRDLGSSYGTFLAGGQRLIANVATPLQNGSRFYLAGEENMFEIIL